jgi:hypothetical protein
MNEFKENSQIYKELIKLKLSKNMKECYKMKIRDHIKISKFIKAIFLGYPIKYTEINILKYVN